MFRDRPWRHLCPDAIIVDRRTRFGNPFPVVGGDRVAAVAVFRAYLRSRPDLVADAIIDLAGRDLACWCPLPEPGEPDWCHAAVWIEVVNP